MTELIHDWNARPRFVDSPPSVLDDTLRDGLQSPSARNPSTVECQTLLDLSARAGSDCAILGLPSGGPVAIARIAELAIYLQGKYPHVERMTAVRTHPVDIAAHKDICDKAGAPLTAALFVGCSPIRAHVEDWSPKELIRMTRDSVASCVQDGIPVLFVTEDTTRSTPRMLHDLYTAALNEGAQRICIADTVGHADPSGVEAIVNFVLELVEDSGTRAGIDWHGHNDRGLSLINAVAAAKFGATRIHTTCLGLGERTGNTPFEQFLTYLLLSGCAPRGDLKALVEYCAAVHEFCEAPLPPNLPIVGSDAYRTSSGIHACAILKALRSNDPEAVDMVYSAVPASLFGRVQEVEIGPMSGKSNVEFKLLQSFPELRGPVLHMCVQSILEHAHQSQSVLDDAEIHNLVANTCADELSREARNA